MFQNRPSNSQEKVDQYFDLPRNALVLCTLLCLLGLLLRFYDLGFPDRYSFDEHHFVKNAHNYLRGTADWNDHPPLGKLSFALSWKYLFQSLFGMRFVSAVAGVGTCLLGGLVAARLFKSGNAGIIACALLLSDGFLIAFSRVALLDMQLVFGCALACALIVMNQTWSRFFAAVVIGLTMAIKLSGVTLLVPLVAGPWLLAPAKAQLRREVFFVCVSGCVIFAVYLSTWALGLTLSGQLLGGHWWSPWSQAWAAHHQMYLHHLGLNDWQHSQLSPFYEWPLPARPLVHFLLRQADGRYRVLLSMGNPLSWWSAWAAMLWAALRLFRSPLGGLKEARRVPQRGAQVFLLFGFCAAMSPWVLTDRDSYTYHFLPAYFFALILLAGFLSQFLQSAQRWLTPLLLSCILALSLFYAPLWCGFPLHYSQVRARPFIKLGPWQAAPKETPTRQELEVIQEPEAQSAP